MAKFEVTAPNGMIYTFNAKKAPVAVRFLFDPQGSDEKAATRYIITTHKTVENAGKSFTVPQWRDLLTPDSVVTDIREV